MSDPGTIRPILLWGMTGVGKSTVGPLLAERLGVGCVDLDARVEAAAGRSIGAIFADEGEAGFRRREKAALTEVYAAADAGVIVLGGGALVDAAARGRARRAGLVVGLGAAIATLAERLAGATDRPLLADDDAELEARLTALYTRRAAAYADVDVHVPTDGLEPAQIVERIVARLGEEAAA